MLGVIKPKASLDFDYRLDYIRGNFRMFDR